jgi:hypothetical protein
MIEILHSQEGAELAARLRADLSINGYDSVGGDDITVIVLSEHTLSDPQVKDALYAALDRGAQVIPVLAEPLPLPKLIDHLSPIDLSDRYTFSQVQAQLDQARRHDARLPLRVRTPSIRRSNNRAGLTIGAIALAMFIIGVYGVAVLNIEAPREEYNAIDTEVAATRDFLIGPTLESFLPLLPGSAEEAAQYPVTLEAIPTRLRPFVAATATEVAREQQGD